MDFSPANAGLQDHVYLHFLPNPGQFPKCHQISLPQGLLPVTKFSKMDGPGPPRFFIHRNVAHSLHTMDIARKNTALWYVLLNVFCDPVKVHAARFHCADPMHSQFLYSAIIISKEIWSHSGRATGELFHDMHF